MSARTISIFGAIICIAITLVCVMWVPYGNTGTSDAAVAHFLAVLGAVLVVAACFGYLSWQAKTGARGNEKPYARIVVSYFLGIAALVTCTLLWRTYVDLSYKTYWTIQIVQYCALLGIWLVAEYAGHMSDDREGSATVNSYRMATLSTELDNLSDRLSSLESGEARALLKAVGSVKDEIRYLPKYVDGPFGAELVPTVRAWTARANDAVAELSTTADVETAPRSQCVALLDDAAMLKRRIAGWKRS